MDFNAITLFKFVGAVVLYLFLPLTTLTYYFSRRGRRVAEVERICSILKIAPNYQKVYDTEQLSYYLWALVYASVVSCAGLTLLFFSTEIGFPNAEFPAIRSGAAVESGAAGEFPQKGSRLVFAMAFLGAYLWGLQHIFRRYALNDLIPSVYYGLSMRMIFAAVTALVLYNAYAALAGSGDSQNGMTATVWPALAFLTGMFPQRGLRWLTDRIPILSPKSNAAVREAPLDMIEGIELHDVLRLEELGIETCYDLAAADAVPLTLRTPYSARQLIDWILQAKLCVYFGTAVKDLRQQGIRVISDLETLADQDLEALAKATSVTKYALERAQESVKTDLEIPRLREAGQLLGTFWEREVESARPSETNGSSREKLQIPGHG